MDESKLGEEGEELELALMDEWVRVEKEMEIREILIRTERGWEGRKWSSAKAREAKDFSKRRKAMGKEIEKKEKNKFFNT